MDTHKHVSTTYGKLDVHWRQVQTALAGLSKWNCKLLFVQYIPTGVSALHPKTGLPILVLRSCRYQVSGLLPTCPSFHCCRCYPPSPLPPHSLVASLSLAPPLAHHRHTTGTASLDGLQKSLQSQPPSLSPGLVSGVWVPRNVSSQAAPSLIRYLQALHPSSPHSVHQIRSASASYHSLFNPPSTGTFLSLLFSTLFLSTPTTPCFSFLSLTTAESTGNRAIDGRPNSVLCRSRRDSGTVHLY